MIRIPVVSSNLSSVGWEPLEEGADTGTMEIEFHSGHVYQYDNVPRTVYDRLRFAASPGGFFAAQVRGQYDDRRVS